MLHQPVCSWYKTGERADKLLGCAAIQRHLDKLEEQAERNLRKLSRGGTTAGSSLQGEAGMLAEKDLDGLMSKKFTSNMPLQ